MPELPEVEAERVRLEPAMRGARITRVLLRRANLRRPFPKGFVADLEGRRVVSVDRRGKYLLVVLDNAATLLMHLGMTGSFRIDRVAKAICTDTGFRLRDRRLFLAAADGDAVSP